MTEKSNENFKDLIDFQKAQEFENFERSLVRRKKDGTIYRNRKEMKEKYDKSYLPYPFAALFNLDYCNNVFVNYIKNSFFFAGPLTLISAYAINKEIKLKGFRAKRLSYYFSHYILVNLILMSVFTLDCLIFCDYCKPWSDIYNIENDSQYFKKTLLPKLKNEKTSFDVQVERTKAEGLKDEEL